MRKRLREELADLIGVLALLLALAAGAALWVILALAVGRGSSAAWPVSIPAVRQNGEVKR